jgi:hypothetical protein
MLIGKSGGYIHRSTNSGATFISNTTGSIATNWTSMKMSYDGKYCLASSSSNYVYLSSNSGETFAVTTDTTGTSISSGFGYNTDIAMSKTGQYMVCVKQSSPYDLIKISTDFGVTWKQKNLLSYFSTSCAVSEDGQTIYLGSYYGPKLYKITDLSNNSPTITEITAAAAMNCHIILLATDPLYIFISDFQLKKMWYSIDGGTNFTQVVTTAYFTTCAISSDKTYIIGNDNNFSKLFISVPVYNNPHVFVASNNINNMVNVLSCCAISNSGQYMLSCHYSGGAYISINYGSTFTKLTNPNASYACAISGNGLIILICHYSGQIFRTTNYGVSFTLVSVNAYWRSIKMSYDGKYCLASNNNNIYLSSDSGATFALTFDTSGTYVSAGYGYNTDIAMSKTGQVMVCVKNASTYDSIKISTDYGVTWKQKTFAVLNNFSTSCAVSEDGQTIYLGSADFLKLYKITNISADSPTITEITAAADINCSNILLATDPLYIFISDRKLKKMWYSIDGGGTPFTQISTTHYFSTCAITPDKQYIIGNNNYNSSLLKLYISGP